MQETAFIDSEIFRWVILPVLIFLARMTDVSIGTIRIMVLNKGKRLLTPLLGFFEILIWLLAIRQIFIQLTNPVCYIAYAGGFAMGNYVGIIIEEKLAIGFGLIRVITHKDATELINCLNRQGYGATSIEAKGSTGKVHVIYSIVKRSEIAKVIHIIKKYNPKAFYTIEDVKAVKEGIFPSPPAPRDIRSGKS